MGPVVPHNAGAAGRAWQQYFPAAGLQTPIGAELMGGRVDSPLAQNSPVVGVAVPSTRILMGLNQQSAGPCDC